LDVLVGDGVTVAVGVGVGVRVGVGVGVGSGELVVDELRRAVVGVGLLCVVGWDWVLVVGVGVGVAGATEVLVAGAVGDSVGADEVSAAEAVLAEAEATSAAGVADGSSKVINFGRFLDTRSTEASDVSVL